MTVSINTAPISPLRQRMQHDMMMRGLGPHTQKDYVRHVKRLAAFLGVKRPGFSGGSFLWAMRPYRGS